MDVFSIGGHSSEEEEILCPILVSLNVWILLYHVCFFVSRHCRIWCVLVQNLVISYRAITHSSCGLAQDDFLRPRPTDMIDISLEPVKRAALIDWEFFKTEWVGFFPSHPARPATSPGLVAGGLPEPHLAIVRRGCGCALGEEPVPWAFLWRNVLLITTSPSTRRH